MKIFLKLLIIIVFMEIISKVIINSKFVVSTTPTTSTTNRINIWLNEKNNGNVTSYSIDAFDPLLGWSPKKNFKDEANNITFNSIGVRGSQEYNENKNLNKLRIAFIGDSFTFGEEVKDDETFPFQLEKEIKNSEVMNFAVHGYGIDQMQLRNERDILKNKPDIVVYAYIYDDINRAFIDFFNYAKPKYFFDKNNNLFLSTKSIKTPEILYKNIKKRSSFIDLTKIIYDRTVGQPNEEELKKLSYLIWKKVVMETNNAGSLPIFLYLPTAKEMIDTTQENLWTEDFMYDFCKEEKINCFSARKYISEKYSEGVNYNISRHYEPHTNIIVAKALANDLKKIYEVPILKN